VYMCERIHARVKMLVALCCCTWLGAICIASEGTKDTRILANHRVVSFFRTASYGQRKPVLIHRARVFFQDRAGIFWVGSSSGLFTYDEKRDLWAECSESEESNSFRYVKTICQDGAGRIWLKSLRQEIRFSDGKTWHHNDELAPPYPIPADNSVMFPGRNSTVWFVTDAGLISFDGWLWTQPTSLAENVRGAHSGVAIRYGEQRDEGAMSHGNMEVPQLRGVGSMNRTTQIGRTEIFSRTVYQGLQDRSGYIWLGTTKAIVRIDTRKGKWRRYPLSGVAEVRQIYEDRQNRIWCADWEGHLAVYKEKQDTWVAYDLSTYFPQIQPKEISSIYQDRAGQIMLGTADGGLIIFKEDEGSWKMADDTAVAPIYGVTCISEDRLGRIWLGVHDGIVVLDP
jgi:ligand-binding sensor domain-containing protein